MYPYYRPYRPNMQLHSNDIARIQRLYGRGTGSVNGNGGSGGSGGGGSGGMFKSLFKISHENFWILNYCPLSIH